MNMFTPRGVYPGSELSTSSAPSNHEPSCPHDLERLLRAVTERVPVIDVVDLYAFAGSYTSKAKALTDLARQIGMWP